jgi:acyl-CoA thioester hydrolase
MHRKGVDAVVARMNLQYKTPLRPDDEFISRVGLTKEGIKYVFHHDIFRAADEQLCFRGKVELVCIVNGRLANSPDYDAAFAKYIQS